MTFLLVKVSGVALLEKGLTSAKPGYADYVRRTSAFLPLPPRR
jgi:steroid 5-alpha reductase family enzyme